MFRTEDSTHFDLPWEVLEALIRGISSIDLQSMPIRDRSEAFDFLLHYGYDFNEPEDASEILSFYEDAVKFIQTRLLANPAGTDWAALGEPLSPVSMIPPDILKSKDLLDLITYASQGPAPHRYWACAILKVMHTIAHIHNSPLYKCFDEARTQILAKFYSVLTFEKDGTVLLGRPGGRQLQLYGFEAKDVKTRESILVKLLCKKENVAEEVRDLIGVRFITFTPAEALLVVNILREEKVVVFSNIIPSRSRNSLLDLEHMREEYRKLLEAYEDGAHTAREMETLLRNITPGPTEGKDFSAHNPSSSQDYRSIHITGRQLIRTLYLGSGTTENRFFFPYEIQIMDKESYLESKDGSSAHSLYKRKQLAMARRRVLGPLLQTS